jgi:hypothetical protein
MPLEFESEDALQNALTAEQSLPIEQELVEPELQPLEFGSEQELQDALSSQQDVVSPPQDVVQDQQGLPQQAPSGLDPAGLASAVLGQSIPQPQEAPQLDRKTIIDSYGPQNNTIAQKLPVGMDPIHPADMEAVTDVLSKSFFSMSTTGILLDPTERVMYVTSIMENTAIRADVRAQLIDQAMRDGKIVPEALPKAWFEARGLLLLPPNLNLDDLDGELV